MTGTVILGRGRLTFNGLEYSCHGLTVEMGRLSQSVKASADAAKAFCLTIDLAHPGPVTRKELDDFLAASRTSLRQPAPVVTKKKRAQWKLDPRARQWGAR